MCLLGDVLSAATGVERAGTPVAITSSMSIMFKYEPPNEFRVGREGEFYFTRHLSKLPSKISLE